MPLPGQQSDDELASADTAPRIFAFSRLNLHMRPIAGAPGAFAQTERALRFMAGELLEVSLISRFSAASQAEKLLPQPQDFTALGLLNVNPRRSSPE